MVEGTDSVMRMFGIVATIMGIAFVVLISIFLLSFFNK